MTAKLELLSILPMKEHMRGADTFQFQNFIEKTQLLVLKLVSITTEGTPTIVSHLNGFIAKCSKEKSFSQSPYLPLNTTQTRIMCL